MDRLPWDVEPVKNKRSTARRGFDGGFNMWGASEQNPANSEHIEKKKKIVADLMALRRMKLMQQNRLRSASSLSFDLPTLDGPPSLVALDRKHVEPLLKGTNLKEKLDQAFGENSLEKASQHFVSLTSEKQRPNSREKVEMQRKKFLDGLTRDGKTKLQEHRKQRVTKQQKLVEKQHELDEQAAAVGKAGLDWRDSSSSPQTLGEDLEYFANETGKRIKSMETNVMYLKIKYGPPKKVRPPFATTSFQTFKAFHKEQVDIVSRIIDDMLDEVFRLASRDSASDSELIQMLLKSDLQQWDDYQVQAIKQQVLLDIMNEIIVETCNEHMYNLSEECVYLGRMSVVYSEDIVLDSTHAVVTATKGRPKKAPDNIVDQTWYGVKIARDRTHFGLWMHSQSTIKEDADIRRQSPTVQKAVTPPPVVVESAPDADVISSELAVCKRNTVFGNSVELRDYALKEFDIWESMSFAVPEFSFNNRQSLGVSVAVPSFDHKLLALGTIKGDILVYDMLFQPPRPIRCVSFEGKSQDTIFKIQWSLDTARLLSVSVTGCVIVWSMLYAPYVSSEDLNSLEIENEFTNSQQLTALCVMESLKKDFTFQEGPLTTSSNEIHRPTIAHFYPTLSFSGSQDTVMVCLSNGDILKCNLLNLIQKRCVEQIMPGTDQKLEPVYVYGTDIIPSKEINIIGQEVHAELFRHHRHAVVDLCFVNNCQDMVSIDALFNMCIWRYSAEHLNTFGWFTPYKRFALSFVEEILVSQGADVVRFEDEVALKKKIKGRKTKNKQLIARERQGVLKEIQFSGLDKQKPWHTDEFHDELEDEEKANKLPKFFTRIFSPPGFQPTDVAAGGSTFYAITYKRDTELIVKFAERVYEISAHKAVKVLQLAVSPSGDRLYFMLLYNEHLPKVRKHISIVDFDLEKLQLGNIGPIQINLNSEKFDICKTAAGARFSVSRVNHVLGTEYIVCNAVGNLQVHSVLSGRQVIHSPADKEKMALVKHGLVLPPKVSKMAWGANTLLLNPDGLTSYIGIFPLIGVDNKATVTSRVIDLSDESTEEQRVAVQSAYKNLLAIKRAKGETGQDDSAEADTFEINWYKPEQAQVQENMSCREMPIELYLRMTLNNMLDVVLAIASGQRIPQDVRRNIWKQDWGRMQEYFKQETKENSTTG